MTVDVVADGTSDSLQMMGAISCKLYIEHILMQQTPDRLLVPSQIPLAAAPRVTAPATTAKLVKVFDEDDIAAAIQVPLYYKSKGKGRGKPVFFAPEKTAVGQLFELAQQLGLPEPEFTHHSIGLCHAPRHAVMVRFSGLAAQDISGSQSLKNGKEAVAKQILIQILNENRAAEPETDTAVILANISGTSTPV